MPNPDLLVPSPLQEVETAVTRHYGFRLLVKRDDLIHPGFGGNKWRKLKLCFAAIKDQNFAGILTFGGPFSNHIYATALAARHFGLRCTIVVRGAVDDEENPVLRIVRENDAEIIGVSRAEYTRRHDVGYIEELKVQFPGSMIVPEGGSGAEGIAGASEIAHEIVEQLNGYPDHLFVPVGTGGTALGILEVLGGKTNVHGIAALRRHLIENSLDALRQHHSVDSDKLDIDDNFHCGGTRKVE